MCAITQTFQYILICLHLCSSLLYMPYQGTTLVKRRNSSYISLSIPNYCSENLIYCTTNLETDSFNLSTKPVISSLDAAHSSEVAVLLCTTALICSIPISTCLTDSA